METCKSMSQTAGRLRRERKRTRLYYFTENGYLRTVTKMFTVNVISSRFSPSEYQNFQESQLKE